MRNMAQTAKHLLGHLRKGSKRFWLNTAAIGAVEFALIAPVMLTMYFGVIEVTNALIVNRRVTSIALTAADLVSQAASVSNSDMADIFKASTAILEPYSAANIQIKITSVVADSTNKTKVAWSDGYNTTARSVGSNITLPTGLTSAGTSVIFAEVSYNWVSPVVGQLLKSGIAMGDKAYLKPRRSVAVARVN
ncbi:MAG: pilus assembly protein [Rhizobiales bacterium]|nr:pilus assembly protein [Hyphomicrobiales bacterium]